MYTFIAYTLLLLFGIRIMKRKKIMYVYAHHIVRFFHHRGEGASLGGCAW